VAGSKIAFLRIPLVYFLLAAIICAEFFAILWLNAGHFTYSLDDPYIHLAMSENLLQGHYGINLQEFSAPSSSIVWPFLLTPFCRLTGSYFLFIPLVINVLISVLVLRVLTQVLRRVLGGKSHLSSMLCFFLFALNLVGLVFTGMEHSLQVLLAVSVFYGLIQLLYEKHLGSWLLAGIVLGPLVRYENIALSLSACFVMWLVRYRRQAVFLMAGALLPLIAFSFFLHFNGVGWLPSSVLAKSDVMAEAGSVEKIFLNLKENLFEKRGRGFLFLISSGILVVAALRNKFSAEQRLLALFSLGVAGLHLLVGRMGWFSRYEVYAWSVVLLGLVVVFQSPLRKWLEKDKWFLQHAVCAGAAIVLCPAYLYAHIMTPLGCSNVYEQQYQMHRFITQYWKQPVAANDIGYISFQNSKHYILDIWGLGSYTALKNRADTNPAWMQQLAKKHGTNLAMIYLREPLPVNWKKVATLRLGHRRTTVSEANVAFYALNDETVPEIQEALEAFSESLPSGVVLLPVER